MNKRIFFILFIFTNVQYVSADSEVASFCFSDEEVVFSCRSTDGETISLCSSSKVTKSDGFMQYRFGTVGQIPTFIFPKALRHPKDDFKSGTVPYSGGGASYIKFIREDYSYTVFTGIGKGWEKEGLVVKKMDEPFSYIQCDGSVVSELGPALFQELGLQKDPNELEFEIP